ncbi:TDP-4-oxo-6-deoxy-D-glucose aminotransferase [Paenibacillus sp. A3]|uniref:dTDP-4-amino-4,6-dideoxygalactose transaminase n=1 Tax=Paenibacillus sp. A3 TaxID=1337054 RepID=UPI0006D5845F|nr:dTDP-4-amino-4,6-dideoxygalactose transaminase [Paenibacillus sp. A3]KPV59756.1 TDP-4-oxo-6-deoxy-D-glucose aminotransferase [Paenibacillus sp. A3]
MIPFNVPAVTGNEEQYLKQAIENRKFSGDGSFTKKCNELLESKMGSYKALLTTSCTHALEMGALLANIQPGDEVIMPSYTFVSTANAFVLRGARIKFVDIRPDTLNLDENLIEQAITKNTKAIVPVHYAGVSCEMDTIMDLAEKYKLMVIEDAAQGIMSQYKGRYLGTIGQMGCFSFHETKNIQCGEGGAILFQEQPLFERAEIIREKGTNRSRFFRGQIDKYTWVDIGSSYLPSELNAAFLFGQLEKAEEVNNNRISTWNKYFDQLKPLQDREALVLPHVPAHCTHNAHIFYIKARNLEERSDLIHFLKEREVGAVFHYVPLHTSEVGLKHGTFSDTDRFTTAESNRIIRLPLYYNMSEQDLDKIIDCVYAYYNKEYVLSV